MRKNAGSKGARAIKKQLEALCFDIEESYSQRGPLSAKFSSGPVFRFDCSDTISQAQKDLNTQRARRKREIVLETYRKMTLAPGQ